MGVKDSFIGKLLGNSNEFSQEQVDQTINLLLEHGLKRGASSIHIEPHGQLIWVRYRIHGALHGLHKLPADALIPLVSTLRRKANLPADAIMPQEGSFTDTISDTELTIRVNTMRVVNGERAVLHFSPLTVQRSHTPTNLADLGFWGANLDLINKTLAHIHGLVLINGTRHSHRTASLYALLHVLRTAAISIGTIEETIERHIPGVSQTKVAAHDALSYEGALRAALRQDMNAVMLANLPTKTVADEAVYAATNGHLIMAGLHSDTAAKGILHLRHMGIEPYMLAAALRLSIGLQSVRKLCPACRERSALTKEQAGHLEQLFGMTTVTTRKRVHLLEQKALKAGIGIDLPLSSSTTHLTYHWQASPNGCEHCHHTGYDGTVSLVEIFPGGEYLYSTLTAKTTAADLHAAALQQGFIPLALDGMIKALRGETTLAEVVHEASLG